MSQSPALFSDVVSEGQVRIDSWQDFQEFYSDLGHTKGRWCFRGQRSSDWALETSLERVTKGFADRVLAEQFFIAAFKRRAHQFVRITPEKGDLMEWLAL